LKPVEKGTASSSGAAQLGESTQLTGPEQVQNSMLHGGSRRGSIRKGMTKLMKTLSNNINTTVYAIPKKVPVRAATARIVDKELNPEFTKRFGVYLNRHRFYHLACLFGMFQDGIYVVIKERKRKHDRITKGIVAGITIASSPIPPAYAALNAMANVLAGPVLSAIFKTKNPRKFMDRYRTSMQVYQNRAIRRY
jgi:hypothetical protein